LRDRGRTSVRRGGRSTRERSSRPPVVGRGSNRLDLDVVLRVEAIEKKRVDEDEDDEDEDGSLLREPETERVAAELEIGEHVGEKHTAAEAADRPDRQQKEHDAKIRPPISRERCREAGIFAKRTGGGAALAPVRRFTHDVSLRSGGRGGILLRRQLSGKRARVSPAPWPSAGGGLVPTPRRLRLFALVGSLHAISCQRGEPTFEPEEELHLVAAQRAIEVSQLVDVSDVAEPQKERRAAEIPRVDLRMPLELAAQLSVEVDARDRVAI